MECGVRNTSKSFDNLRGRVARILSCVNPNTCIGTLLSRANYALHTSACGIPSMSRVCHFPSSCTWVTSAPHALQVTRVSCATLRAGVCSGGLSRSAWCQVLRARVCGCVLSLSMSRLRSADAGVTKGRAVLHHLPRFSGPSPLRCGTRAVARSPPARSDAPLRSAAPVYGWLRLYGWLQAAACRRDRDPMRAAEVGGR